MCDSSIHACIMCSKTFAGKKSKANKFCSANCYHASQRAGHYIGKRPTIHTYNCSHCLSPVTHRGKSMTRSGSASENIFCGRGCYDEFRAEAKNASGKHCHNCGDYFNRKGMPESAKYCSAECRYAKKKPEPITCAACDVKFSAIQAVFRAGDSRWYARISNRKTCSQDCLSLFYSSDQSRKDKISLAMSGAKHPNWQGGSHRGDKRGPGWQKTAEKCREIHGRVCADCKMTEKEGMDKGWGRLQVNHIKPFHQCANKSAANSQSNLEALCKSCHAKADWKWRKENPIQLLLPIFRPRKG